MTNDITIQSQSDIGLDYDQLLPLLHVFGDLLPNPLSMRLDLTAYDRKLLENAEIAYALFDGKKPLTNKFRDTEHQDSAQGENRRVASENGASLK